MKKVWSMFLLILFCFTSAVAEDDIWVEETWKQIDREVDCDGLPLLIHARVLSVPDEVEACEYQMDNLSNEFMNQIRNKVDWAALGCDTSNGKWRAPSKAWPEYIFLSEPDIYPSCEIRSNCRLQIDNMSSGYLRASEPLVYTNTELIEIKGISNDYIMSQAEMIASECGIQLGNILRVGQCDDVERIHHDLIIAAESAGRNTDIDVETAAGYVFADVIYPVYFNGLRLYSGDQVSTSEEYWIPDMHMRVAVTAGRGVLSVDSPLIDSNHMKAVTEMKPVISVEEVLRCMENRYSSIYRPDLKSVTVQTLALEYVPISKIDFSSKGFTLYPAWVAQTHEKWRNESGELWDWVGYEAYDARTGEVIF